MEVEIGVMYAEGGGRGYQPRSTDGRERLKKARKWILPSEPTEGVSPASTLTS